MQKLDGHDAIGLRKIAAVAIHGLEYRTHAAVAQPPFKNVAIAQYGIGRRGRRSGAPHRLHLNRVIDGQNIDGVGRADFACRRGRRANGIHFDGGSVVAGTQFSPCNFRLDRAKQRGRQLSPPVSLIEQGDHVPR